MAVRSFVRYLILRAGSGEARVITKRPTSLRWDEVAWRIDVNVPGVWGRVQDETIKLSVPDPDETDLRVQAMKEGT